MIRILLEIRPMPTSNMTRSILNPKTGRNMVVRTSEAVQWKKRAVSMLQVFKMQTKLHTIEGPVALSLDVWREINSGDLDNYYKGLLDAMKEARILRDDKQVKEHRRCRLLTDPKRPRFDIILWPLEAQGVLIPLDAEPDPIIPDCFKLPSER